jgi:hypothetical protein
MRRMLKRQLRSSVIGFVKHIGISEDVWKSIASTRIIRGMTERHEYLRRTTD